MEALFIFASEEGIIFVHALAKQTLALDKFIKEAVAQEGL